jgi:small subunit ribosomal protein S17
MKGSELRDLSVEELESKSQELNQELFNLKFQLATGQLENSARLPQTRKDIARVIKKIRVGLVTSDKMDKTVVVKVEKLVKHPTYKKYIKRRVTYKAHDEENQCVIGDKVAIVETRPLSRDKRWRVREILEKNVIV